MAAPALFTEAVKPVSTPREIHGLKFGLLNARQIRKLAVVKINNRQLYHESVQEPVPGGPLDVRLGVTQRLQECATCRQSVMDCPGHMGYIKLELPVFHIGLIKQTLSILQVICKSCSRLLFKSPESRGEWLHKLRRRNQDRSQIDKVLAKIVKECKTPKECGHCKMFNGSVKKLLGTLRIVHEKFEEKQGVNLDELREQFDYMCQKSQDFVSKLTAKLHEDLTPVVAYALFENIPEEDIELLGMDVSVSHPKDLILTNLLVPPVCIRPTVQMSENQTNEDDLTIKLQEIVQLNDVIHRLISEGSAANKIRAQWENLQGTIALYINADTTGIPQDLQTSKRIRALCQRLKGKQGRFRQNLSGKRVDFCGRTVISPDPNLQIRQVAVPVHMAKILTYPEQVNRYNIDRLKTLVAIGPDVYPGANYVKFRNGSRAFLAFSKRSEIAQSLAIGDIVERHMHDDDVVLFNRQPSLHRISIMCHRAKVMQWLTLRFNECICTPYNADFDGDEMNLHLPQTEESRAEAGVLMNVVDCIISPKAGDPIISPTQDFLTCGYLLTMKDVFFDRASFWRLAATIVDADATVDIPQPAILKPKELWTGKQLFSLVLRPNNSAGKPINLETKEKNYTRKGEYMCPKDGWVVIQDSKLLCGNVTKVTIGAGSKEGIVSAIARDDSCKSATAFMSRLAKLTSRYLCDRGFSIGLEDVTPSRSLLDSKAALIKKGYEDCDALIQQWKAGKLPLKPGCNAEQTLESLMNGELGKVREKAGDVCREQLPPWNAPLIMAVSGSKGSLLNMCQMIACLGQQTVNGHRIPDGFGNRSLPHFEVNARHPSAKGFVQNSFYSGLTSTEFFFHTMGGREGIVDTAVKTAETGYMQRRLMKALEDLSVKYDYSVRTSTNEIAQFVYGDDALEPMKMEEGMQPVNYSKLLNYAKQNYRRKEPWLSPSEYLGTAERYLEALQGSHLPSFEEFKSRTKAFVKTLAESHFKCRQSMNITEEATPDPASQPQLYSLFKAVNAIEDLSESQLIGFLTMCWNRYEHALVTPGEAVGAVAAQSIGEPGTQMTLKTFHFAGVASMNITLGVPRIKEIINAVKDIGTPIITARLINETEEISARAAKGHIEKLLLKDVCMRVEEMYTTSSAYLRFIINMDMIEKLMLHVTKEDIKQAILKAKAQKMKLKAENITVIEPDEIKIESPEARKERLYFSLQELKTSVPQVIINGIPTVKRAVISQDSTGKYHLLVEGTGLAAVMGTPGIDARRCRTNHVIETEAVLGIEAARQCIINEIKYTLSEHGITVDSRHIMLLADVMTCKGVIYGITRFGVKMMKDSTLMLASFEMTTDHLFHAAMRGFNDGVTGVSESIIMGNRVPLGTGMFEVLMDISDVTEGRVPERRRPLLLS